MKMRKKTTMLVAGTLVLAAIVCAVNETQTHMPVGKLVMTCREVIKASTPDLTLKKCSGKYQYKTDSIYDAEQAVSLVGECPTSFQRFDQFSSIAFIAYNVAEDIDVNHQFYDPTGVDDRTGTKYKQKFFWWSKSGYPGEKSYGMFKGVIKDGILKFTYTITKASEIDLLVTNDFAAVRDTMTTTNKPVKSSFNVEGAITLGSEGHSTSGGVTYTAKKGAAAGKLIK